MKITEKNGIVKWEDGCGVPIGIGMSCGDDNGWKCQACGNLPESKKEDWYKVRGNWFHVIKSEDGTIYVNGKLFPEPTPYNQRLKAMGWDFHKELVSVFEIVEMDYILKAPTAWLGAKKINLLPKESTMKTRYAVVNLKEKVEFEKKWEMPYGYNNCPHISFNQREAIGWVNQNLGPNERKDYVVERHTGGKTDIVWKIGSLVGIQEEDEYEDF